MNIKESLEKATILLKGISYTDPYSESKNILSFLLKKDISYLFAHSDQELSPKISKKYFDIVNKRKEGYPLQYIYGYEEFFGREFIVNENVLIPRRDTEVSVENIIKIIRSKNLKSILDIGTGSGIVGITINLETNIKTVACDISKCALEVAKENADKLNADVFFIESDLFNNIHEKFDIIYSNPPYIESDVIDTLQIEVRDHEPILALDGGEDGLYFYRKIISNAPRYLNKNGFLIFEIGYNQGEKVSELMIDKFDVKVIKDLNNLDRVIIGKMRD